MALNKKYSYKDFLDKDLTKEPASDFNNSEIIGSCFYQQAGLNTKVFPVGITGVTFQECNLDNVFIPVGNTTEKCSRKKIMRQNDLEDWLVDDSGNPIEARSKKEYLRLGISIDPKDLPISKLDKPITEIKMEELRQAAIDTIKALPDDVAKLAGVI